MNNSLDSPPMSSEPSPRSASPPSDGIFISSFEKKLKEGLFSTAKSYALSVKEGSTRRPTVQVSPKSSPNKISSDLYQIYEKDAIRLQNFISKEKSKASSSSSTRSKQRINDQVVHAPSTPLALARSLESELESAEAEQLSHHNASSSSGSASTSAYAAFIHAHSPRRTTPSSKDASPVSHPSGLSTFHESVEAKPPPLATRAYAELPFPAVTLGANTNVDTHVDTNVGTNVGAAVRSKPLRRGSVPQKATRSVGPVVSQSPAAKLQRFMQMIKVCLSLVLFFCCLVGPLLIGDRIWQQWKGPATALELPRPTAPPPVMTPIACTSACTSTSNSTSTSTSSSTTTSTSTTPRTSASSSSSRPFSRILGNIQARKRQAERLQRVLDILGSSAMLEKYEISGQRGSLSPSIPFKTIRYFMGSGSQQSGAGVADWSW